MRLVILKLNIELSCQPFNIHHLYSRIYFSCFQKYLEQVFLLLVQHARTKRLQDTELSVKACC